MSVRERVLLNSVTWKVGPGLIESEISLEISNVSWNMKIGPVRTDPNRLLDDLDFQSKVLDKCDKLVQ